MTAFVLRRPAIAMLLAVIGGIFAAQNVLADKPIAYKARVMKLSDERYQFEINIVHEDNGWDHFVNRWEIVGNGGKVLATDVLHYPRIGEGIVWRVLTGVKVDADTEYVIYRLHDLKHGYGREKLVRLPAGAQADTGWQ